MGMKIRILGALLLGLSALVACSSGGVSPGLMLTAQRVQAGLQAGVVETSAGDVHYLAGGRGETVLLLHGIFARKEHWVDASRKLRSGYRVVMIDLPGFGDNRPLREGGYRLGAQAALLEEVMAALDIKRAHIGANSMGAQIAGMLAARRPDKVASLAFIGGPLGVRSPVRSDMERALSAGQSPLLVQRDGDFERRMAWLFPEAPDAPGSVLRKWAAEELANAPLNARIWREVSRLDWVPLQALAPRLEMPSLILWCDQDRIFHVSGAEVLARALPNAQVQILSRCGHVPMLDRPSRTGNLYRAFLDQL